MKDDIPKCMIKKYEELRSCAIDKTLNIGRNSLAYMLLLREGVAGWLKGWRKIVERPAIRIPKMEQINDDKTSVTLPDNHSLTSLTVILANMLLYQIEMKEVSC